MARIEPLLDLCRDEIAAKGFPGAAFAVGDAQQTWFGTVGRFTYEPSAPQVGLDSLFDLASLTKVMSTTPAAMLLHDDGLLDLEKPVQSYIPGFAGENKDRVKVRNLLLHDSGLPAYANLSAHKDPASARKAVLEIALRAKPGEKTEYSCLSMITLMQIVEAIAKEPLDKFIARRLFQPLGMADTMYNPPESLKARCVPTEGTLQGRVHDPAALYCGGVSGNAGLFSTVRDVAAYARLMLERGAAVGKQILCANTIESWTKKQEEKGSRALGWDTKSARSSSAGRRFSMRSFGHTGFTGTSIWVDPENRIFAVLMTNRVHPTAENSRITAFRPKFHDAASEALKRA